MQMDIDTQALKTYLESKKGFHIDPPTVDIEHHSNPQEKLESQNLRSDALHIVKDSIYEVSFDITSADAVLLHSSFKSDVGIRVDIEAKKIWVQYYIKTSKLVTNAEETHEWQMSQKKESLNKAIYQIMREVNDHNRNNQK